MSEYTELTAKIEALEKRVKYLEDTFATLADMNKSGEMGQYIAQRQRALAASKLVNAATGTQKLNADAQQQVIDQLAAEKAEMDTRIEEAIRAAAQNTPAEDDLAEQFTYRDVPGGVEIQGFNGFEGVGALVIPNTIQGKPVVSIGQEALRGTHFERVILPQSVQYIGNKAFYDCPNLRGILLPQNLKSIKAESFQGCENLKNIVIPKTLQTLKEWAFAGSGIKNVLIPAGVKKIPVGCFDRCNSLKKVVLSDGVEIIEDYAFTHTSVTKITLPSSVKKVEHNALVVTQSYSKLLRESRKIEIAVLGKDTEIDVIPQDAIVYCLAGSKVQKAARTAGILVKPLSEFK